MGYQQKIVTEGTVAGGMSNTLHQSQHAECSPYYHPIYITVIVVRPASFWCDVMQQIYQTYQYIGHRVRRGHGSLFIVYLSTLLLLPYTVFTADSNGASFWNSGSLEWFMTQTCDICTGSTQFHTTSLNGNRGAMRFRDNGVFAIFQIFFLLANMCKFGE